MKEIEGRVRKACVEYKLIDANDRIAVGVSGGKDSVTLLAALAGLQKYCGIPYELVALILDPCFDGVETDYSPIEELCASLDVPLRIRRSDVGKIVFEDRKEHNPCSLCARMRRGILHDMAKENGCNKIALGHHMDDAVETFFLNLFHEGRIASFAPKCYLSRKDLTMIRPLVLCTEREVACAAARSKLPVVKSRCPMDKNSERENIKNFIKEMDGRYPDFLTRTFTALKGGNVSGFGGGHDE